MAQSIQPDQASRAADAITETHEVRRRGSWRYLFLFKRRPKITGVPREWEPPDLSTEAGKQAYYKQLDEEGFVSPLSLERLGLKPSDELRSDLEELDEHLLSDFMRLDQEAKHFQNLYYFYQWWFIFGALLTTVIAAAGVLIYDSSAEMPLLGMKWLTLLQVITAILSGAVTTISVLNAAHSPQEQWFKRRTQAETLRSLYYQFLGRLGPLAIADNAERIRALDQRILDVLKNTVEARNT